MICVEWPATNKNEVRYSSLQRFRGLEANAVTLCEVDRTRSHSTSRHLYVGQSRARHVLFVAEYVNDDSKDPVHTERR